MRVGVYIDGFNLYYGVLKHSPYKWLDVQKLSEFLLEEGEELEFVKYFTARTKGATGHRQNIYLRALEAHCSKLEIIYGYYLENKTEMVPVDAGVGDPALDGRVKVWKKEEKGSDVNLAIYMLDDVWRKKIDRVLLVTNDGDLANAITLARQRYNDRRLEVGIVPPVSGNRRVTRGLFMASDFRRNINHVEMLGGAQLPYHINGTEYTKPQRWIGER